MSFTEAVISCFNNYTNYFGRARRREFWYFYLFDLAVTAVLGGISGAADASALTTAVNLITFLIAIPLICVHVRRMHDIGRSGWWILVGLIPVVGEIILIVWLCRDSQPGDNRYGPNPKGV